MAHSTSTVPAPHPSPRRWRILGLLGIAQLMLILDVTVVAVALPNIATDLGLGRQQLTWVVSGYTLAFGGLLLLGGRAADLFGARRLVIAGLGVFAGASLLAGLAPTGWALLAGRVLQGLAAAILSPSALSLVVTTFGGAERDRALGIWSALGGGGAALGLLLGGLLTAGPGWPWVFFVNVPVGLLLALSLYRVLPRDAASRPPGRLDLPRGGAGDRRHRHPHLRADPGRRPRLDQRRHGRADGGRGRPLPGVRGPGPACGPAADGPAAAWTAPGGGRDAARARGHRADDHRVLPRLLLLSELPRLQRPPDRAAVPPGRPGHHGRRDGRRPSPRPARARRLGVAGLGVAGIGMWVAGTVADPAAMVAGISLAAAGTGALFVVASATALGQVDPHEAGLASGIVSTFHEFGAAFVSSLAATSLAGTSSAGFSRGFITAAVVAAVTALVTLAIAPGRQTEGR
jgi:MFS family permease